MKPTVSIILNQNIINNATPTGQITMVEGPFVKLSLPFIPSAATFSVLAIMSDLEITEAYNIRLTVNHEEDKDILIFDTGINNIGPLSSQGMMVELENLNLDVKITNAPIEKTGVYVVTLYINQEEYKQEFVISHKPLIKNA